MQLVQVSAESIRISHPLPFPLRDRHGVLLARKDYVVGSKAHLVEIEKRGGGLYIDVQGLESKHRAYISRLLTMVRDDKAIREIAGTRITGTPLEERMSAVNPDTKPDWLNLQEQCNNLLRNSSPVSFMVRLERLLGLLDHHLNRNADSVLFALIYLSATEKQRYSATHAMLVYAMCGLAAREVLNWPTQEQTLLARAALTMNIGMTELQDRLAVQTEAIYPVQRMQVSGHAERSVEMLQTMGVNDPHWLQAVREHHAQTPGPLDAKSRGERTARLIQRADMFAARLAPRAFRQPISPAAAMQACYFDENGQVDEAGAALIKAVGIYQPGSFVRLATNETAIVIKRGIDTTRPRVAVLLNHAGIAIAEPSLRDTSLREHRIISSVPHREVKVQINLEKLLALTAVTD